MKRAIFAIAACLAGTGALQALDFQELTPKDPAAMALGGCFTSVQTAETSFFGNPAYFSDSKGGLDISTDAWAYVQPTYANLSALRKAVSGSNVVGDLASLMPSDDGIGGGASLGIGYAGKGLGMGLFAITDDYAAGTSLPGATLQSDTELDAVFGLGIPIKLFGDTLSIGGDFRPYYRVRSNEALADMVTSLIQGGGSDFSSAFLGAVQTYAGFGLSMDAGASMRMGSFDLGLAVRDISPAFPLWKGSFQDLLDYIRDEGSLPVTSNTSTKATFIPDLSLGLAWRPRIAPGKLDPALFLEAQDPVRVAENWQGWASALQMIHAGAELKILNFLSLRGGINRGWLSAGAGLKLLFLDLDAAVFTEELGDLPGDSPRSGLALQASLRF